MAALLLFALAFLSALGLWAFYAFSSAAALTGSFAEACQSLLIRCVELYSLVKLIFMWSGAAMLAIGISYALVRAALNLIRSKKAISSFPLKAKRNTIALIDHEGAFAFTHGLLNPRIYLSKGLLTALSPAEVKAVLFHELEHKRSLDPLKFFVLNFIKDAFFYIPAAGRLAFFARLKKEAEADDTAAKRLGHPLCLASAMLKVAQTSVFTPGAPFAGTDEVAGRVRRLVEGKEHRFSLSRKSAFASVTIAALMLLSLSMPLYAGIEKHECTVKRCSVHIHKIDNCKEHCSTMHHHR